MARSSDLRKIQKFFEGIEKEVVSTAGIIASSYAKDTSKTIMEEWAEILARNIEMGIISPPLTDETAKNRAARGNPEFPPWLESGDLTSFIEFRWTSMPSKNYDLLEVGIWDTSTKICHSNDITPYKLGLINEYGFSGSFKDENGNVTTINIPARPHFKNSAVDIGYELDRIARDSITKTQIALGRQKKSIKANKLFGNTIYDLAAVAPDRYRASGSNTTKIGRFYTQSGKITFKWDDTDASDSGKAIID